MQTSSVYTRYWLSYHICILMSYASRVDALDVQCVNVKHAMLEPNHKTVFGGNLQKIEGPAKATEDPTQWSEEPKALRVLTLT